ncbi:MAG: cytochrome P450 [Jatrophihabitans sp.]
MTLTSSVAGGRHRVPPGPPLSATPGLLRKLTADRLGMMNYAAARYGDAARLAVGPKTLYVFNHPDHAKHVLADNAGNYHKGIGLVQAKRAIGDGLLTSDGPLWREQRRLIQPVFQAKRIADQAPVIADEADRLVKRLLEHRSDETINVTEEMTGLTLGVLGRALLEDDLGAFGGIGHSFEAVQDQAMFEMVSLSMVPMWVPLPKQLRFRKAREHLDGVVDTLVANRLARTDGAGDNVMSRLIESTNREADPAVARQRMHDELVTLLLAGHETTASTLSWSLYLIGEHPHVWQRLHAEAVEVLGDRQPTSEDLHKLTYTTMVVEEVMRMYPPVWILPRLAQADDEVGGYHVPAGSDVVISPYIMHRHPAFWKDPERFDPERFAPDAVVNRPRYAYIPFGAGPRFCVGNNLGMIEAVFVLASIVRRMWLERQPGYQVVPEPMLSLRIRGGLPMTVHPMP